jgi:hypothetical protein
MHVIADELALAESSVSRWPGVPNKMGPGPGWTRVRSPERAAPELHSANQSALINCTTRSRVFCWRSFPVCPEIVPSLIPL